MSYYVAVMYSGQRIIPGCLFSARRRFERSSDGTIRKRGWAVTISGQTVPYKGSPDETGAFWNLSGYPPDSAIQTQEKALAYLKVKLAALAQLFSVDGQWFEIVPGDASAPIRFQPRWGEFTIEEGLLVNVARWSVTCETDFIIPFDSGDVYNQANHPPEESWQLEQEDDVGRVFRLTHTVSASGQKRYDSSGAIIAEGWEVARDLVLGGATAGSGAVNVLGIDTDRVASAGVCNLTGFAAYNRKRSEQVDEGQGRFTVVETWTLFNPADKPTGLTAGVAIEDFQVETRYGNDSGLTSVSISGTIKGLEERSGDTVTVTRWTNAALRAAGITEAWAKALCQSVSGVVIHPSAISTSISRNSLSGVVTYTASFDNRYAPTTDGVLSYQTSIDINNAADVFASIPVPFRTPGPVLQPMFTVTEKRITVRTDVIYRVIFGAPVVPVSIDNVTKALTYIGAYTQLFLQNDTVSYVEESGRYSRSTSLVWQ